MLILLAKGLSYLLCRLAINIGKRETKQMNNKALIILNTVLIILCFLILFGVFVFPKLADMQRQAAHSSDLDYWCSRERDSLIAGKAAYDEWRASNGDKAEVPYFPDHTRYDEWHNLGRRIVETLPYETSPQEKFKEPGSIEAYTSGDRRNWCSLR